MPITANKEGKASLLKRERDCTILVRVLLGVVAKNIRKQAWQHSSGVPKPFSPFSTMIFFRSCFCQPSRANQASRSSSSDLHNWQNGMTVCCLNWVVRYWRISVPLRSLHLTTGDWFVVWHCVGYLIPNLEVAVKGPTCSLWHHCMAEYYKCCFFIQSIVY